MWNWRSSQTLITFECSILSKEHPPSPTTGPILHHIGRSNLICGCCIALHYSLTGLNQIGDWWLTRPCPASSQMLEVVPGSGRVARHPVDLWQVSALISALLRSSQRLHIRLCGHVCHIRIEPEDPHPHCCSTPDLVSLGAGSLSYSYSHWHRLFYLFDPEWDVKTGILPATALRWEEEGAFAREGVCFETACY